MGIRETLNEKQGLATGIAIALVVIGLIAIGWQLGRGGGHTIREAYYTTDDGQTWFKESVTHIPPFEYEGQEAVRAVIYSCDGGESTFLGYMERYPPAVIQRYEELRAGGGEVEELAMMELESAGLQYRRPGMPPGAWVGPDSPYFQQVLDVRCPDGSQEQPRIVYP